MKKRLKQANKNVGIAFHKLLTASIWGTLDARPAGLAGDDELVPAAGRGFGGQYGSVELEDSVLFGI